MALKCCVCGNKIGMMETSSSLAAEYSNEKICSKCMSKKRELYSVDTFTESKKYFDEYKLSGDLPSNVLDTIDLWIDRGLDILNKSINEQNQREEEQKLFKDHMLTSGYNFEGFKIISYNGIISGEVVLGTGFLSELSASINDFFGSTSEEFSSKMEKAKEIATTKMITASISKGGNAIIGVDFDYTTFGNNMIAVSANGTSVIIERIQE